ncbi:hypothetical protein B0T22DRAFT_409646 [Podospora appendiculata]|uniref:Ysc84 actin-binding domain-containing protein n=1 Tax=Podospora appendiculata TaxID=314037 RepID=A0AAE0X580_9PEZI|nr:hypothetical protein B0T22DRAFT_409646 [Podospora appendiculata]
MSSGQKNIPALGGNNPDYYAETASIAGAGAPGSNPQGHHHSPRPPPPPVQQQQQQQQHYQQQPYYPPPPTNQGYNGSIPPPFFPPPPGHIQDHDIPPPKPPRPISGSAGVGNVAPSSSSSAPPPSSTGKPTFGERLHQWSVKAGVPINKVTNKLGSEAFWPSTMDLECDKAARILKSFCKDGFYTTASAHDTASGGGVPPLSPRPGSSSGPKSKPKVLVKIPKSVIQSAAGLAIFTTFRTGLHLSGAGGSGIVVARLPSGAWSPPSGFLVHTLGAGFLVGLDIYDCVCVLRTPEAVRAFTRPRVSLGGEIGLVAGPVGAGAAVDAAIGPGSSTKPVWSYMKSRGFYAGVQADGTVVIARPDANAAFYGRRGITADEILAGNVPSSSAVVQQGGGGVMWPQGGRRLMEVLKAAEGRRDVDEGVLKEVSSGPTPGDLGVSDTEKEAVVSPGGWDGRY